MDMDKPQEAKAIAAIIEHNVATMVVDITNMPLTRPGVAKIGFMVMMSAFCTRYAQENKIEKSATESPEERRKIADEIAQHLSTMLAEFVESDVMKVRHIDDDNVESFVSELRAKALAASREAMGKTAPPEPFGTIA